MNKIDARKTSAGRHRSVKTLVLLAVATTVSGCYLPAAQRDFARDGTVPWQCKGTPDLTQQQCYDFSWNLDVATTVAMLSPTLASFTGGTEVINRPANIGVAFTKVATPTVFDPNLPNVTLYDGTAPTSRVVGVAWEINSSTAPVGFVGDRDVWTQDPTTSNWWLTAWVVRGYQNHPNVFAATHPCLTSTTSILTSTTDACFTASHTEPFEVLVSNDDGVMAPGINAIVEGLYSLGDDTVRTVHVVAPAFNQSGAGGQTTGPGFVVSASGTNTASGKPATAVYSTDPARPSGSGSPADSVVYALGTLRLSPDLVVSGINEGQNMGSVVDISGTVGAARRGRLHGVPAIATSQGTGGGFATTGLADGVVATLALVEEWRLGRTVNTTNSVLNINIPTCLATFSPRGTVQTVVSTGNANYGVQDCASTATANSVIHDIDAFNKGFIGIADVGAKKPPNWP